MKEWNRDPLKRVITWKGLDNQNGERTREREREEGSKREEGINLYSYGVSNEREG